MGFIIRRAAVDDAATGGERKQWRLSRMIVGQNYMRTEFILCALALVLNR